MHSSAFFFIDRDWHTYTDGRPSTPANSSMTSGLNFALPFFPAPSIFASAPAIQKMHPHTYTHACIKVLVFFFTLSLFVTFILSILCLLSHPPSSHPCSPFTGSLLFIHRVFWLWIHSLFFWGFLGVFFFLFTLFFILQDLLHHLISALLSNGNILALH